MENSVYFIRKQLSQIESEETSGKRRDVIQKILNYVDIIKMANDREVTIVKTLEAFAKRKEVGVEHIDLSQENFKLEKIDFKTLIQLVLQESRFRHEARNAPSIPATMEISKELPFIYGNENLLIQVFLNLLGNAYDAMRESPEKRIMIKAFPLSSGADFAQIEFQDTGSGIPESLRTKVWEYLFTTKTHQGGSGMGLFWCKTIVENIHKGKFGLNRKKAKELLFT